MMTERERFEGAQWFTDIQNENNPSAELLQRWLKWLDASEGNRQAYQAAEVAWHESRCVDLAQLERDPEPADELPYDPSLSVEAWLAQSKNSRVRAPKTRRSWALPALAASALITVALVVVGLLRSSMVSNGSFLTRTAEHHALKLSDGSGVTLGARTRLSVTYTDEVRDLWLDAGEAFFTVRSDSRRPFRVHTPVGVITAVGTAFNVRATANKVAVTVTEGAVNVTDVQATPIRLASGQQLTFSPRSEPVIRKGDLPQAGRWREGWLVYRNEPLRDVIADVSRYTNRQITVRDSTPSDLRYTGAVSQDSVVEWVEALPEVFPLAVRASSREIEIAAR